jgi:hypothetical protein
MSTARLWLDALTKAGAIERRADGKVEVPAPPKPAWSNRSFLTDEAADMAEAERKWLDKPRRRI